MFRYREYSRRSSPQPSAPTTTHAAGVRLPFVTLLVDGVGSRDNSCHPDRVDDARRRTEMSSLIAVPELITTAATDLANIGSTITAAHAAAVSPTSGVLAAGADEVSAAIAAVFSAHGQGYQALSAQAVAFHDQFVKALSEARNAYAA